MRQNKIPCHSCAYYKEGLRMPITDEHYKDIRDHFISLLGGECCVCGSVFNIELHHKQPLNSKMGRGRDIRMWEWFKAYADNNISLLCNDCHKKYHSKD